MKQEFRNNDHRRILIASKLYIHKTFNKGTINEKVALDGVTLHLNEGDFCTIIGGNGACKSTTLNAVAGVLPVDSGQILIDGVDVTGLPEHKRAKYLGRVFQDPMTGTVADMERKSKSVSARKLKEAVKGKGAQNYFAYAEDRCEKIKGTVSAFLLQETDRHLQFNGKNHRCADEA